MVLNSNLQNKSHLSDTSTFFFFFPTRHILRWRNTKWHIVLLHGKKPGEVCSPDETLRQMRLKQNRPWSTLIAESSPMFCSYKLTTFGSVFLTHIRKVPQAASKQMALQVCTSHGDTDANAKAGDGGQAKKSYIWDTTDALEKGLMAHHVPVHRNQYLCHLTSAVPKKSI